MEDQRPRLLRWWHRQTIQNFAHEGELIARSRIRLDIVGRFLVLFGRTVEVEIRTKSADAALAACDGLTVAARHIPRKW
jgi:hypothetical protein